VTRVAGSAVSTMITGHCFVTTSTMVSLRNLHAEASLSLAKATRNVALVA